MVVGIGLGLMLQNDYRVLSNLRGGTEAFYASVAGMEWAKSEIARVTDFPPLPTNQAKNLPSGAFAVAFLSSSQTGPFAAKNVVRSSGAKGGSQHVLQAQLTKSYDLSDAALGLRGNGLRVNLGGHAIFVSGADHDPANGNLVPNAKPRHSVSTSDDTLRGLVQEALGDPPRVGLIDNSPGVQAVATSGFLPATFVAQLADELCAATGTVVHAIPNGGSLTLENQTWGAAAVPQVHCVEGLSAASDFVNLTGIAGAGIVVVRDADLNLSGAFRWDGLIIVTGNDISLRVAGSSPKDLFGAVVINETGVPGTNRALFDVDGHFRLLFSRKALNHAAPLIPTVSLNSAYASLPFLISQDYWRTVTP